MKNFISISIKKLLLSSLIILSFTLSNVYAQNTRVVVMPPEKASPLQEKFIAGGGRVTIDGIVVQNWGVPMTAIREEQGVFIITIKGLVSNCESFPYALTNTVSTDVSYVGQVSTSVNCDNGDTDLWFWVKKLPDDFTDIGFTFTVIVPSGVPEDLPFTPYVDQLNKKSKNAPLPKKCTLDMVTQKKTCN